MAAAPAAMNHFAYFSEIEEHFSRRRGTLLLLSTLDWALIETWRDAGVPLEAVLRGIDNAFDRYEARSHKAGGRVRKVNGLAWCAQAVMQAAEEIVDASTGLAPERPRAHDAGFETERIAAVLERTAKALDAAQMALDELDRTLSVLEEKLLAALEAASGEAELVAIRAEAEGALAASKARLSAEQLRQIRRQFVQKRLLEVRSLPRLSLFYMGLED
jgi:hypothetical protein